MSDYQYFLRFTLGDEWFGIGVDHVIEVLHFLSINQMPDARPEVIGMMRFREAVVPVIDLRIHFGLPPTYDINTPIIITSTNGNLLGLVVDDVDDLERIEPSQITEYDQGDDRNIRRVVRLEEYIMFLPDLTAIMPGNIPSPAGDVT